MLNPFFNNDENRARAGWRVLGQFFLALLIGLFLTALLRFVIASAGSLIFGISMTAGALFSTWAAARGLDKRRWSEYGAALDKSWFLECVFGFALAALAVTVIFIIEYLAGWLTVTGFGWQTGVSQYYVWAFISYFLFMIFIGFYEELIFRGYQITNLAEGLNLPSVSRNHAAGLAVILTSLLFGVLHWQNPNATWLSTLNIAIAGLMLAFPFLVTGRLSYSIGIHIGWNFFQGGIFGFPVSGLINRTSLLQTDQAGPVLVTGGVFGPEAGLLGMLGLILIAAGLILVFKIKEQSIALNERFGMYNLPERKV